MLNQHHKEYQWQTIYIQFFSKSKQMAFHRVLQSVYINRSVTLSVLLNSSFTPCRRIKLLWHWLQQLASCVIHEKKKNQRGESDLRLQEANSSLCIEPRWLDVYAFCCLCINVHAYEKIPCLSHSQWQTKVVDETCFFKALLTWK